MDSDNAGRKEKQNVKHAVSIHLKPDPPHFGCVSVGFSYRLTIVVTNHSSGPERLRVSCTPLHSTNDNKVSFNLNQVVLAKGISTTLELELVADNPGAFSYNLTIIQSSGLKNTFIISAFVLPLEVFKSLSKSLKLDNRNIYEEGVKMLKHSVVAEASLSTDYSAALLDEDDLDVSFNRVNWLLVSK